MILWGEQYYCAHSMALEIGWHDGLILEAMLTLKHNEMVRGGMQTCTTSGAEAMKEEMLRQRQHLTADDCSREAHTKTSFVVKYC